RKPDVRVEPDLLARELVTMIGDVVREDAEQDPSGDAFDQVVVVEEYAAVGLEGLHAGHEGAAADGTALRRDFDFPRGRAEDGDHRPEMAGYDEQRLLAAGREGAG